MEKLAANKIYPMFYPDALRAVWLSYTTRYLADQDINLIEYFKKDPRNPNELLDSGHYEDEQQHNDAVNVQEEMPHNS